MTLNIEASVEGMFSPPAGDFSPRQFYFRWVVTARETEWRDRAERERERGEGVRKFSLSPWHVSWEQLTRMESVSQSVLRHGQLWGQLASTPMSEEHSVWQTTFLQRWEGTGESWTEERGVSSCQFNHWPPRLANNSKADRYSGKSWQWFLKKILINFIFRRKTGGRKLA